MTVYWYVWATLCTDTLQRKCLNYTKFSATVCYHHTVSFFSLDVQLYLYWCIVIGSSKELSIDICWVQVAITIENTKIKDHGNNRCTFAVEYTNEPSKLFSNLIGGSKYFTSELFKCANQIAVILLHFKESEKRISFSLSLYIFIAGYISRNCVQRYILCYSKHCPFNP